MNDYDRGRCTAFAEIEFMIEGLSKGQESSEVIARVLEYIHNERNFIKGKNNEINGNQQR